MRHLNQSLKDYNNYVIKSCTNTGVWEVVEKDPQTGAPIITYDFVNREYLNMQNAFQVPQPHILEPQAGADLSSVGLQHNENAISMDMMSEPEKAQFLGLQKKLNKALLDGGKDLF